MRKFFLLLAVVSSIWADGEDPFYSLPIRPVDRQKITKIIHTMGKDSVVQLLWKKREIERLGDEIEHLHPLRFLWHIFTDERLKRDMKVIHKSYFKWDGFMGGCRRRLKEMSKKGNLEQYLPGFCYEVGISHDAALRRVRIRDWDGFVKLML